MKHKLFLGVCLASAAAASCEDDPRAALRIDEARAWRVSAGDRRVAVDVDVRAYEGLGGNLGTYCVSVLFPGESDYRARCHADLEDGDEKTIHFISERSDIGGGVIRISARVGQKRTDDTDVTVPP